MTELIDTITITNIDNLREEDNNTIINTDTLRETDLANIINTDTLTKEDIITINNTDNLRLEDTETINNTNDLRSEDDLLIENKNDLREIDIITFIIPYESINIPKLTQGNIKEEYELLNGLFMGNQLYEETINLKDVKLTKIIDLL